MDACQLCEKYTEVEHCVPWQRQTKKCTRTGVWKRWMCSLLPTHPVDPTRPAPPQPEAQPLRKGSPLKVPHQLAPGKWGFNTPASKNTRILMTDVISPHSSFFDKWETEAHIPQLHRKYTHRCFTVVSRLLYSLCHLSLN